MATYQIIFIVLTGVILFLYGIQQFSLEVRRVAGERLGRVLSRMTSRPWKGFLTGAGVTAIVQSSTAVTVLAVSLVNAGVLSFRGSLGIVIGSNLGSTVTTQLVALGISELGPVLIVTGFVLSLIRIRYAIFGKMIFYFGFIFFSLDLISDHLSPLASHPEVMRMMAHATNPGLGVLVGLVLTLIVQSSSVATGVLVVGTAAGLIPMEAALAMMLGANLGTTATALIASRVAGLEARRTAVAHLLFNFGGVCIFLPFLGPFQSWLTGLGLADEGRMLATGHLVFNLVTAMVFLLGIRPYERLILRMVRD